MSFWFGDIENDKLPEEDYIKRWWVKDSDFDREIEFLTLPGPSF
ncbi:MAG: hypothetical protein V3U54_06400 [Thermodesulfobacteriota bacterium]